jgi:AraC-like DNA-binding protein
MAMHLYGDAFDPRDFQDPIFAVGMEIRSGGLNQEVHSHPQSELILTMRGLLTCEVAKGMWMVPPQCALWIPGGMKHGAKAVGELEAYVLFVDPSLASGLPAECCTVSVDPLLRELVTTVAQLPSFYDREGRDGRLVHTMLDRLEIAPVDRLRLPLPADKRLRKIAEALAADPSDRATIGEWARRVAMSERTLSRFIVRETGMSFGRWRQQFQIALALKRLSSGDPVQSVAFDLGYNSVSAFITMFKKALGEPPGKYLPQGRPRRDHAREFCRSVPCL